MKCNEIDTFTHEHSACQEAVEWIKKSKLTTCAKTWAKCQRGDWMIWALRRSGKMDKNMAVKIACECALHVLPLFEKKYPDDKRPRVAIETALAYINGNATMERVIQAKKDARESRYAAAYAAYAAAAAHAAYAAAAYADAAAAAVRAAAAAAAYADAAADAARAAYVARAADAAYAAYTARAADAAADVARAAYAADAAYAAYAAYAYAAADVARAAYADDAAYAAYADAARIKERGWQANMLRKLFGNPFKEGK